VLVPASTEPPFDGHRPHRAVVEAMWTMGIGCARYDLVAPAGPVHPAHPAAVNRHLHRAADVLERIARLDAGATVTLVASGDAVAVAMSVAASAGARSDWPDLRSLLLLAPVDGDDVPPAWAADVARLVGLDEHRPRPAPAEPVTRRVLRRLGW
jgi:hypothetical protein